MDQLQDIKKELKLVKEQNDKIYNAIAGNELLGQRGMKHELADHSGKLANHESRLDKIENNAWKDRLKTGAIAGVGAGAIGALLQKIIPAKVFAFVANLFM